MNNKILVLVVVFSLLAFSPNITAKERRGAELVVTKTDGQQITGELIAVKETSLLMLDSRSGIDVSADIDDIREIRILRKSHFWKSVGVGSLAGAIGGALLGAVSYQEPSEIDNRFKAMMLGAFGFGTLGAIIGAGIGAFSGKDETIHLEGKSPKETKEVLEELRREARVPDAQ